jgi:hypothetical protein
LRDAVRLDLRAPNHEVVAVAGRHASGWETALILVGLMGIAVGAFHWSASPWFIDAKQAVADWLAGAGVAWPLETAAPWWVLTNYAAQNDVMTLLDGAMLLAYIAATTVVLVAGYALLLAAAVCVAGPWSWARFHHLAQSLIPIAGCGGFLGLSATTVTLLHNEGIAVPFLSGLRACFLSGAILWCTGLAWRIAGSWTRGWRRAAATSGAAGAACLAACAWALLFWIW